MKNRLEKGLSIILVPLLALQPALVSAQEITPLDPEAAGASHVEQARNGTTILNISTPNGAGVSHDRYTTFRVGDLIVNNATRDADSRLAGWISANPNLADGRAAEIWVAEVTGGSQTELRGIMEVAGAKMDVILANEFGILCDGCGFFNIGRATLTTGRPTFDDGGRLSGLDVRQGQVVIGPNGLNPAQRIGLEDTGRVDVIGRAIAIYGRMRADDLRLLAGANKVTYDWYWDDESGTVKGVTPQEGRGAAPALAIDSAALGGMYANSILLVATERGVGVKLDGEMASSGNIRIRSNGRLTIGAPAGAGREGRRPLVKARRNVEVKATGPVELDGIFASEGGAIDIRSDEGLTFRGEASADAIRLEGGGTATIAAILRAGEEIKLHSSRGGLEIDGATEALAGGTLTLSAAGGIRLDGRLAAGEALSAWAGGAVSGSGTLAARSLHLGGAELRLATAIRADLAELTSRGELLFLGTLRGGEARLAAEGALGFGGKMNLAGAARLTSSTALSTATGAELFAGRLDLLAPSLRLDGTLRAHERLSAATPGNLQLVGYALGQEVSLTAGEMRVDGAVGASGTARLAAQGGLDLAAGSRVTGANLILGGERIRAAGELRAEGEAALQAGTGGLSFSGRAEAERITSAVAGDLTNSGSLNARSDLALRAAGQIRNLGDMLSNGNLLLVGREILNEGGTIWAHGDAILGEAGFTTRIENRNARIEAFSGRLVLSAARLDNIGTAPVTRREAPSYAIETAYRPGTDPIAAVNALVDPRHFDAAGNILPGAPAMAYAALWRDLMSGSNRLSPEAATILRPEHAEREDRWDIPFAPRIISDMRSRAAQLGSLNLAADVQALVNPDIFLPGTTVPKSEHAAAYVALWLRLLRGEAEIGAEERSILRPEAIALPRPDPDRAPPTHRFTEDTIRFWAGVNRGNFEEMEVIRYTGGDHVVRAGTLAELVSGGRMQITAEEVNNQHGALSSGGDLVLSGALTNRATGLSRFALITPNRRRCAGCDWMELSHGEVFGGRIEAAGAVQIAGPRRDELHSSSTLDAWALFQGLHEYSMNRWPWTIDAPFHRITRQNLGVVEQRRTEAIAPVAGEGRDIRRQRPEAREIAFLLRPVRPEDHGSTAPAVPLPQATVTPTPTVAALLRDEGSRFGEDDPLYHDYIAFRRWRDGIDFEDFDRAIDRAIDRANPKPRPEPVDNRTDSPLPPIIDETSSPPPPVPPLPPLPIDRGRLERAAEAVIALQRLNTLSAQLSRNPVFDAAAISVIAGRDLAGVALRLSARTADSLQALTGQSPERLAGHFTIASGTSVIAAAPFSTLHPVAGSGGGTALESGGDLSLVNAGDLQLAHLHGMMPGTPPLPAWLLPPSRGVRLALPSGFRGMPRPEDTLESFTLGGDALADPMAGMQLPDGFNRLAGRALPSGAAGRTDPAALGPGGQGSAVRGVFDVIAREDGALTAAPGVIAGGSPLPHDRDEATAPDPLLAGIPGERAPELPLIRAGEGGLSGNGLGAGKPLSIVRRHDGSLAAALAEERALFLHRHDAGATTLHPAMTLSEDGASILPLLNGQALAIRPRALSGLSIFAIAGRDALPGNEGEASAE